MIKKHVAPDNIKLYQLNFDINKLSDGILVIKMMWLFNKNWHFLQFSKQQGAVVFPIKFNYLHQSHTFSSSFVILDELSVLFMMPCKSFLLLQ